MRFPRPLAYFLAFCFSFALGSAAEAMQLTPLIVQAVSQPVIPVQGSDGQSHLVYELQITNVSPLAWQVERLKAVDGERVLLDLSGAELKSRLGPLGSRGGSTELGPQQTAFAWLHVKVAAKNPRPQKIQHLLEIRGKDRTMSFGGGEIPVSAVAPLAIGSPLKGDRWLAGDGCCDSIRHVRALLPIDGRLYASQRFAIDWEKLDEQHRVYVGDSKNPESYFCYGQEAVAVADGVVATSVDGLPNQVPGKLPTIDIDQADGNHVVLQIAPGQYALYAHLKPGSVRVKVGDRVQAGQILGQVGNTGNTSEPHLHFHLMDGPSALTSNGLPYVLKSFDIQGRAPSTEAFDKAAAAGTPLAIQAEKGPAEHRDQLPLDLSLVRFR